MFWLVYLLCCGTEIFFFKRGEKNRKQQQQRLSSVIFHSISFINLKGNLILQFEAISFHYILFWEGQRISFLQERDSEGRKKIENTTNAQWIFCNYFFKCRNKKWKKSFCFSSLKQAKINSRFFVAVNNVSFPSIDISFLS